MKKFLIVALVAFLAGTVEAQEVQLKAKVENAAQFAAEKSKGNFEFQLPATATAEAVSEKASYYTQYFTVEFNEKTKKAKIKMVQDDSRSRRVIVRFLVSNEIRTVSMEGKDYLVDEFYKQYIQ